MSGRRRRRRTLVVVLVMWLLVSVLSGTVLSAVVASGPLGRCTKSTPASSIDEGKASIEWFPPAIRCSWDGRYPDDRRIPVNGIALAGLGWAMLIATTTLLVWIVRRANRAAVRRELGRDPRS